MAASGAAVAGVVACGGGGGGGGGGDWGGGGQTTAERWAETFCELIETCGALYDYYASFDDCYDVTRDELEYDLAELASYGRDCRAAFVEYYDCYLDAFDTDACVSDVYDQCYYAGYDYRYACGIEDARASRRTRLTAR